MSDATDVADAKVAPAADQKTDDKARTQATDIPDDALNKRLERERKKAADDALKSVADKFGMSLDDAAKTLAKAKELEEAQKTEAQRLQEQIAGLSPKATERDRYFKRLEELATLEYDALSDEHKAVVDDLATADDPDGRLKVIASLKRRGITKVAAEPKMADGKDTSKAPAKKPDDKTPPEGTPESHFAKWNSLPSLLKAAYFEQHSDQITKAESYKSRSNN
jgi:hypothetical protein